MMSRVPTINGTKECILLFVRSEPLGQSLQMAFASGGYQVRCVSMETDVLAAVKELAPVLIIVERPGVSSAIVPHLRETAAVPIIALITGREGCSDEECLEEYAHQIDLVLCGQTPRQVVARARAILRRRGPVVQAPRHFRVGNIRMDLDRHEVTVNGRLIELTPKEFQILRQFIEVPGRVFSRQEMLNRVWGEGYALEEHALDVHIHSLRQKLEIRPAEPNLIMTVRGVGYKLRT